MKFIYLASPYTAQNNPALQEARALCASLAAGKLMQMGHVIFSPLTHGHEICRHIKLPQTHEYWMRQCLPLVRAAEEVIVLALPGWQESRGVDEEIALAHELEKPVRFLAPTEFLVENQTYLGLAKSFGYLMRTCQSMYEGPQKRMFL